MPVLKAGLKDISEVRAFILKAWGQAGPSAFGWTGATHETIGEIASEEFLRGLLNDSD